MGTRTICRAAINLIKDSEGVRFSAYPDPATGDKPWTIGYGHTQGVEKGMCISQEEAERLLQVDLEQVGALVEDLLAEGAAVSDNAFGALVCFAFNVGIGNLRHSTLLADVNEQLWPSAANEFLKWNHADGKVLPGLTVRREKERELFLTPT